MVPTAPGFARSAADVGSFTAFPSRQRAAPATAPGFRSVDLPPGLGEQISQHPLPGMIFRCQDLRDQAAGALLETARTDPLQDLELMWLPAF